MRVDLFDFDLPEDLIALRPAVPRDSARMLVVDPHGQPRFEDSGVRDLPAHLQPGDVLVVNDTRVIPARLEGRRRRGDSVAKVEIMLHKRLSDRQWRAFVKPAKKLREGETVVFGEDESKDALAAEVIEKTQDGDVVLTFPIGGRALDSLIERLGAPPLPPYIAGRRTTDAHDREDYQTLFAAKSGAVAAPTASLHFTPELVAALKQRGVAIHCVTLHVGAGTFLPIKVDDTQDHVMHAEWGEIDAATAAALNEARANGRRIVAAGTTSLRLLESAADDQRQLHAFCGETSIFITPGYRFKAVDLLLTNFHLPRSTLFMLVSAFSGLDVMRDAYRHAIEQRYRFYSYGDACLLMPAVHV